MLISINWLRDFVPADISARDIADRLTMAGIEVNGLQDIGSQWNNIIVAEILKIEPHPNADKLALTTVRAGEHIYSVVCGAPNISCGIKVPLALEGAHLPNGIVIKRTKIRGVYSEGMICSETELALGEDSSGIMILSPEARHGLPFSACLGLADTILDLDITPNRSDCLSILGLAREISAIFDLPLSLPEIHLHEQGVPVTERVSVQILDADACPRYAARLITDVRIGPSPLWMRRRLETCGIRSINNVVDVTNYVLLERGQPLHAFDCAQLRDNKIIVKRARLGDRFTTLEGIERSLDNDALMICDGRAPVAIGGIMGGSNSGVSPTTTSVLMESAYFTPGSIAGTSSRLNLKTEASLRFEKGVDIDGILPALHRSAALIAEISRCTVAPGFIDVYPVPLAERKPIVLSKAKTERTIGITLQSAEICSLLERLNCRVLDRGSDMLQVSPPSYRYDINEPIDLIEEVARLKGYEQIPTSVPKAFLHATRTNKQLVLTDLARDIMVSQGFSEVINYSFYAPLLLRDLKLQDHDPRGNPVSLLNPLSSSQSVLRTTLLPSLLLNLNENLNSKVTSVRFFEIANIFLRTHERAQPVESRRIAGLIAGLRLGQHWGLAHEAVDFFDIKGSVETLLDGLRINSYRLVPGSIEPYLHPVRSQMLHIHDEPAGSFGEVHPDILERFYIDSPAYVFEFDFDLIAKYYAFSQKYELFSRFPAVFRDIALIVDESLTYDTILSSIKAFQNPLITDCFVFDCYRGRHIPPGKKSIALRVKFQSAERTLTDVEVNRIHDKLLDHVAHGTGAELRQA